jgi:hypothetical protein
MKKFVKRSRDEFESNLAFESNLKTYITWRLSINEKKRLDRLLDTLKHATNCTDEICSSNCIGVKKVLFHKNEELCPISCKNCIRLKKLVMLHAETCTNISCIFPNCNNTRAKIIHAKTCTDKNCKVSNCHCIRDMIYAKFIHIDLLPISVFD